jgi:hypothetical protein
LTNSVETSLSINPFTEAERIVSLSISCLVCKKKKSFREITIKCKCFYSAVFSFKDFCMKKKEEEEEEEVEQMDLGFNFH